MERVSLNMADMQAVLQFNSAIATNHFRLAYAYSLHINNPVVAEHTYIIFGRSVLHFYTQTHPSYQKMADLSKALSLSQRVTEALPRMALVLRIQGMIHVDLALLIIIGLMMARVAEITQEGNSPT